MPLSNSVIHRYTPPTCTLEVLAQSSPLSRWMGKPVLRQLTFELRFDDPQLPEESRVPIRGDRDQLEALCDAVTTYVQQFLQQPPESFWLSFSGLKDAAKVSNDESTDFHQASLLSKTSTSFKPQIPGTKIYLEANSYLRHNLFLGSLANQASGHVIQLSLLQLFDLATALDEYSADIMALPTFNKTSSVVQFPAWASVAAVLVLALGLTPLTLQYANNIKQKQDQTAKNNNSHQQQIAQQPSPSSNLPTPQAEITPANTPALGSTPPPSITGLPSIPLTFPSTNLPPQSPITGNPALTPSSLTSNEALNLPQTKIPPIAIPSPQIAIQPNPPTQTNSQGIPLRRNLPPRLSIDRKSNSSGISPVPPPQATIPNDISPLTPPSLRSKINSPVNTSSTLADANSSLDRFRSQPRITSPTEVAPNKTSTLFDTPQVAEAREFLKKRWRPPAGFEPTLEYSVMLGVDGSIERVLPLGKAARDYVDIVGMPSIGEPFVSSNRFGQIMRIRVVLSPDGKVQTFPESE